MASNFNFTTKLGLDSAGFKQGVNKVKGSLSSLKSSFLSLAGALGAGLGFTQLLSNLKETATQLSVAKNTLENVSRVTKTYTDGINTMNVEVSNYSENLAFVRRLSEEYGQDLISLATNFAQFTSACKKTDLALEDQKKVYEALTRAAAYYHMSADRTKDMMNAVTQMMSKGKVAAEELRRQLGNALPGAFNIMAAAIGVSNAELDKLMRDGKIISAEVLPQFAAMLNTITQNAHFDSLQTSLNKFQNAWYKLVENSGAESFFKDVVDGSTKVVDYIGRNVKSLLGTIKSFVVAIGSYKLFKGWEKQGKEYLADQQKNLQLLEREYTSFLNKAGLGGKGGKLLGIDANDVKKHNITSPDDIKMIRDYNNTLLKINAVKKELYGISIMSPKDVANIKAANIEFDKMLAKTQTIQVSAKGIGVAFGGIKKLAKTVGSVLKGMGIMAIVSAIIGGITKVFTKIQDTREEWQRINSIYKEYLRNSEKVDVNISQNKVQLESALAIVKDTTKAEYERLYALKQINEALGLTGESQLRMEDLQKLEGQYDKITAAVKRWCDATAIQSKIQYEANSYAEAEAKKKELEARRAELEADKAKMDAQSFDIFGQTKTYYNPIKYDKVTTELAQLEVEIAELDKVMTDAQTNITNYGVTLADLFKDNYTGDKGTEQITELLEKYNKDTKELSNQLKEGAITQEQYNEEFDKLVQEYWKNAAGIGELSIQKILKKVDNGTTLSALEKWYYNLAKAAADAVQRTLISSIADEMLKNIDKEIEEAAEAIDKEIQKAIENDEKKFDLDVKVRDGDFKADTRGGRNKALDYSKSGSDILGEEYALSDDWYKDIKDKYGDLINQSKKLGNATETVQKELDELGKKYLYAAREAKTLESAMNYQKIVEDIKNIRKEMDNLVYSGIKDFATSIDRVVSASETLKKTMEDNDASGWEKFMAVFNLITQIVDTALSMQQTITSLQELSAKLGAAKIAEQTTLNQLLKEELALRMAAAGASDEEIAARFAGITSLLAEKGVLAGILGLKRKEASQTATNTALKAGEAAVTTAAASASAGEAVANATASGAKAPFPYNLIAIAAGVAAVVGALASMSKFANGGIVGGNSTHGDRNIARVNSGEMILNKAQQGTLWSMLNGKGGLGGNVEFKIRGADLVGTINNYTSRKRG